MTDIKELLEKTGLKVAENCFLNKQQLPFITFLEKRNVYGADLKNCIADRNITLELNTAKIDKEIEKLIEDILNKKCYEYEKETIYINTDRYFQINYTFNFKERLEE